MKTWRQYSLEHIHERFTAIRAAQADTVSDVQVLRMVSIDHYPWGERRGWPYKAWLAAMRDYRKKLEAPNDKELQTALPLFDE